MLAAALAAAVGAADGAGAGAVAAEPALATVSFRVGARPIAVRPVSPGFMGVALEYRSIPGLVGPATQPVDPVLVQLLRDLSPVGSPPLRIGGISTDRTWWPVPGMRQPLGITYGLSPRWSAQAQRLAAATGSRLILGIELEANSPRIDSVEGRSLVQAVGRRYIGGLEIGNEPELYTVIPWYRTVHGRPVPWYENTGSPVFARTPSWNPAEFDAQYAQAARQLPAGIPLAGPATGSLPLLTSFEHRFLGPGSRLRTITWHAYGLNQCVTDPRNPQYPSVPNLLSSAASRGFLAGVGPAMGAAHRVGASFRLAEMGSVSCNGRPGVSNTFASALWLLDGLFASASMGVDGVNLHTYPGSINGMFDVAQHHGQWSAIVHPLFYGALMFAQAAPAGARLLPVTSPAPGRVRAWATRAGDRAVRVVLINDSLRWPAHVQLRLTGAGGTAALVRLRAPSADATGSVTLGGRSFGTPATSGLLPPPLPRTVTERDGVYRLTVPPASAALMTVA